MRRKVAQIAVAVTPDSEHHQGYSTIGVVCDDGSAWLIDEQGGKFSGYSQLPPIPQEPTP